MTELIRYASPFETKICIVWPVWDKVLYSLWSFNCLGMNAFGVSFTTDLRIYIAFGWHVAQMQLTDPGIFEMYYKFPCNIYFNIIFVMLKLMFQRKNLKLKWEQWPTFFFLSLFRILMQEIRQKILPKGYPSFPRQIMVIDLFRTWLRPMKVLWYQTFSGNKTY